MSDLPSFPSVSECAKYLFLRSVGDQCILTGGPKENFHVKEAAIKCGVRVTSTGEHGHRTVTLVEVTDSRKEQAHSYNASTPDKKISFSEAIRDGLEVGETVFCQGNRNTITRDIIKRFGKGVCSLNQFVHPEHGRGWNLTRKI